MKKKSEAKDSSLPATENVSFLWWWGKKNYSGMGFSTYPRMAVPLFYRSPHSTQYKHTIREATYIIYMFKYVFYFPQRDLEYWAIDELIMEPCCALKYFPKIEVDFTFHLNISF